MTQRPEHKENWCRDICRTLKSGAGGELKTKWSEKVTNEQVLGPIGEKKTLLNNILRSKAN